MNKQELVQKRFGEILNYKQFHDFEEILSFMKGLDMEQLQSAALCFIIDRKELDKASPADVLNQIQVMQDRVENAVDDF